MARVRQERRLTPLPEPVLEPLKPKSTLKPAQADETSKLFDPAEWHYDPVSRKGLPYDLMRPCSCGCRVFWLVTRGPGDRDCHVICQVCYKSDRYRYRLWNKNDVVYGTLDVRTRRVTYTRPVAEVLELRARMRKS